jgi:hypothetical protein
MIVTYCAIVTPKGEFKEFNEVEFPDFKAKTKLHYKADTYDLALDYLKAVVKHYKKNKKRLPKPKTEEQIQKKYPNSKIMKVHINL